MGSPTTHAPATDGLADYLAMTKRGWPVILAGAVLGLLAAFGYLQSQPSQYTSSASILVTPTGVQNTADLANGRTNAEINLDTEARLVRSTGVATKARDLMKSSAAVDSLVAAVTVSVPPNTEVLSIAFNGTTPAAAQQGAHAFAQAYLTTRAASAQSALDAQMKAIRGQQTTTLRSLRNLVETLAKLHNGSPERAYYSAQKELLTQQLQSLNQLMGKLTTTVVTPGRVLNDAELPGETSGPSSWMILGSGLMAGLLAGLALAALRMRTDRRVRRADEIERLFNLPVIGEPGVLDHLVPAAPGTAGSEAFRRVTNALPKLTGSKTITVMVVGAAAGPSATVVAANLVLTLSRTGQRALLISTDHDDQTACAMVGAPEARGLTELLASADPTTAHPTEVRGHLGLAVVGPGSPMIGVPAALAGSQGRKLFHALCRGYQYVILAVPATSLTADAQSLAVLADTVVLVVETKQTTRVQVADAQQQFEEIGAPVLGAVVVRHGGRRHANAAPAPITSIPSSAQTDQSAVPVAAVAAVADDVTEVQGFPAVRSEPPAGDESLFDKEASSRQAASPHAEWTSLPTESYSTPEGIGSRRVNGNGSGNGSGNDSANDFRELEEAHGQEAAADPGTERDTEDHDKTSGPSISLRPR